MEYSVCSSSELFVPAVHICCLPRIEACSVPYRIHTMQENTPRSDRYFDSSNHVSRGLILWVGVQISSVAYGTSSCHVDVFRVNDSCLQLQTFCSWFGALAWARSISCCGFVFPPIPYQSKPGTGFRRKGMDHKFFLYVVDDTREQTKENMNTSKKYETCLRFCVYSQC